MEDDELLNIGLWEDGAVRQLCRLVSTQMQTQIFVQLSICAKTNFGVSSMKYCYVFLPEPFWIT